jgi:hypothetical protein
MFRESGHRITTVDTHVYLYFSVCVTDYTGREGRGGELKRT